MARRSWDHSWLYAALTLLAAQLGFLVIVYARPGIAAHSAVIAREASRQRSQAGETLYRWTSLFMPIARSRS
jgi:hypothetical protein